MKLMFRQLFLLMLFLLSYHVSATGASLSGNGTAEEPYQITSVEDLIWMRDQISGPNSIYSDKHYKLMCDLDFTGKPDWIPIGNEKEPFNGTFDGGGKVIRNINMGSKEKPAITGENVGLFGYVEKGIIKNLGVDWAGFYVACPIPSSFFLDFNSGGVAGYSNGDIINCYSKGNLSSSSSTSPDYSCRTFIGGIVGYSRGSVSDCHSAGDVSSFDSGHYSSGTSGGVAGLSSGTVFNCYSTGDVSASTLSPYDFSYSGGVVGQSWGKVINCYSSGNITSTSTSSCSGGIVGYSQCAKVTNCRSAGNIGTFSLSTPASFSYTSFSGGIIGYTLNNSIVKDCYSTGNVSSSLSSGFSPTGNYHYYSGGIVGNNQDSHIINCYSLSNVSSFYCPDFSYTGGVAGNSCKGSIINSYSMGEVSSSSSSYSITGGVVGVCISSSIINCYSVGDISSASPYYSISGGIVGICNEGLVSNCYGLNARIQAIAGKNKAFSLRIGYNMGGVFAGNLANKDMVLRVGTSETDLSTVDVVVGENHGNRLKDKPVDLLNAWVQQNPASDEGIKHLGWTVIGGINNGYPVFTPASYQVSFVSEYGPAVADMIVPKGELIDRPADPVWPGFEFKGWFTDKEYKRGWDFAGYRVYDDLLLHAKWVRSTAIDDNEAHKTTVYGAVDMIVIENAQAPVWVLNPAGIVVKTIPNPQIREKIDLNSGYYIVRIEKTSYKVIVY